MPLGCFRRRAAFELSCGHSVQQNTRGSLQSDTIDLDYIGRGRPWIAMSKLLEHVARNRAYWDDLARQYVEAGERAWAQEEPAWGIWHVPEAELQVFSEQLSGKDAIELGCAPPTFPLGSHGAEPASWGSTTPRLSLARRAAYSGNTGSIFRSSTATLKR